MLTLYNYLKKLWKKSIPYDKWNNWLRIRLEEQAQKPSLPENEKLTISTAKITSKPKQAVPKQKN